MKKIVVYIDIIEGLQEIDRDKFRLIKINKNRAVVTTPNGTTVRRIVRFVKNEEEVICDGCIYVIK